MADTNQKKSKALLAAQYALFFGLGFALIYWQYTKLTPADMRDLGTAWTQVSHNAWIFIPITIVGFLSHLFRALRWRLMMEPLNIVPDVVNATGAVFVGYLTNLLLPRMGEVAKCTLLAKYENKPADKIIGTIVAERAFDMICLLLICLLTFFVQVDVVTSYFNEKLLPAFEGKNLMLWAIVGVVGLAAFLGFLFWLYQRNKSGKIGQLIKGLGEGVASILTLKKRGLFLLYTLLIWGAYFCLILLGFWALPQTSNLGVGPALSILVFGSLGMIVTPGGIGAYPQVLQSVLSLLYAIPGSFALAFGWICWLAQTAIMVIFGAISFLLLPIYNKRKNEQAAVDHR